MDCLGARLQKTREQEVGLDPESVVRQFRDEVEPDPPFLDPAPPMAVDPGQNQRRHSGRGRWFVVAAVVAAVNTAVFLSNSRLQSGLE